MPDVSDVLAGRYELRESLPGGGAGEGFHAWDRRERRDVVLRVHVAARLPAGALQRYKAAISAARRAPHPAVILPLELCVGDGPPFAVFEPLIGEDLAAHRARVGRFAWGRAFELAARCAEALASVTAATGVFHGALKPGDLWIAADGEAQILELGAGELGVQRAPPRDGTLFIEYRAPEQLDGSRGSARSDIYTLGVLLFEMLADMPPFSGPSAFMATHAAALAPMPTLEAAAPGVPVTAVKAAQQLLARALARDPRERFADMAEMARALDLARRTIGSPVARLAEGPPRVSTSDPEPAPPTASRAIDDPTTMLRIPALRIDKDGRPESSVKRARVGVFEERAPSPLPSPPPVAAVVVHEPVAERTEIHPRPQQPPVDRTEILPRRPPSSPVAEVTLPLEPQSPHVVTSEDERTAFHPRSAPRRLASTADTTLMLADEEPRAAIRASGPTMTASALRPPGPPASRSRTLLIVVNVLCGLLVLLGLVLMSQGRR